jgi:hypothetical protein
VSYGAWRFKCNILSLAYKIKAKTSGKRQRERERERKIETNFKYLGF